MLDRVFPGLKSETWGTQRRVGPLKGDRRRDPLIARWVSAGDVGAPCAFLRRGLHALWAGAAARWPARQADYWLHGEIPLIETRGREKLSRPRASIVILEATHFLDNGEVWTRGKYKVVEVFKDDGVKFEGLWRVGELDF